MQKRILSFLLIVSTALLTGCVAGSGKRPLDCAPAKWATKNSDVWFETTVIKDGSFIYYGEWEHDGEKTDIQVGFNSINGAVFFTSLADENAITEGWCSFYKNKFTVEIFEDIDNLFNGKYGKLVFYKVEN